MDITRERSSFLVRYKIAILGVTFLSLAFLILYWIDINGAEAIDNSEIDTANVSFRTIDEYVLTRAVVEPAYSFIQSVPTWGTVVDVAVKAGDRIEKGGIIVKLENLDLERETATAKIDYQRQDSLLQDAIQQKALDRSSYLREIADIEFEIKSMEIEIDAKSDLVDLGHFPKVKLLELENELSHNRDIRKLVIEDEKIRTSSSDKSIQNKEAILVQLANKVKIAEKALNNLTVKASHTGTVTETLINQGEIIPSGAQVARIDSDQEYIL